VHRALAVVALLLACGKGKDEPARGTPGTGREPPPAPIEPPPAPTPPGPPAPPADPEPLEAGSLSLEQTGDGWDLHGDGLPARSTDGRRLARVERRWQQTRVTRLELVIEELPARRRLDSVLIWDAARDATAPRARLDQRVGAANALLDRSAWLSLVAAESVFPDGWIQCEAEQRFEVGGFAVSWRAPHLRVTDRKGKAVIDEDRPAWVVKEAPAGCGGTYLGGAWLDPERYLLLELDHCGHCGVAPLTVLEHWDTK
jgi:hypothetical protein